MGGLLASRASDDPGGTGAVLVALVIGLFFVLARVAYVLDLRRRRMMTPDERRIEREAVEDAGVESPAEE